MLPPLLAEHFARPRHAGELPGATHEGSARNPACGDSLLLRLRVEENRIAQAAFRAEGCSALLASASLVAEALHGRSVREALALDAAALVREAGGVPRDKEHAPALLGRAIREALASVRES